MDNSVDLQILLETGKNPPSAIVISNEAKKEEHVKAMLLSAKQFAIKKGIESEMQGIRHALQDPVTERNLDSIYNFQVLMLKDKIVPPVITESKDVIQNNNGTSYKTTSAVYKVDKQAYFSTLPPNWRTYLTFPESDTKVDLADIPTKALMPGNSREYLQWKTETINGFHEGQKIAQEMFSYALNKLNKDYLGMVRFHEFVLEGKISMPSLNRTDLAVTNTGSVLTLDQKLLTIQSLPTFEGNLLKWSAWLQPVQYNPSQQVATINNAE